MNKHTIQRWRECIYMLIAIALVVFGGPLADYIAQTLGIIK